MIQAHGQKAVLFVVAVLVGGAIAGDAPKATPEVTGEWVGTWGPYLPDVAAPKENQKSMDCKVSRQGGVWQATFEGECGRPYKYTITMEGRQAGEAILFKGTTDLGEKDGGVYDWIGRANDKEFVGFYTSSKYAGVFRLSRKKVGSSGAGGPPARIRQDSSSR